jgi:hypothetical protein
MGTLTVTEASMNAMLSHIVIDKQCSDIIINVCQLMIVSPIGLIALKMTIDIDVVVKPMMGSGVNLEKISQTAMILKTQSVSMAVV